jgi:transcription termination factor 2
MNFVPYQHQIEAQNIMLEMERIGKGGILADGMGLGKTLTMAMFLKTNKIPNKTVLIVCPISLLKTWERELIRVNTTVNTPSIIVYHGSKRSFSSILNCDYVITTYSILGSGELNSCEWGRVVLDESHYIKNGLRNKPPKCAKAAFIVGKRSEKNWCISGTPLNNRITDLIAQCVFIGTKPYNNPNWWEDNEDHQEELNKWRNLFILRRTKEGLLSPPIYHDILVEPGPVETRLVDSLRLNASIDFDNWKRTTGLEKIKLQAKILGLITKLRIVSNSLYCGEVIIDTTEVLKNSIKISRMIEDMDDQIFKDKKQGLVVFSQFTSFLSVLEQVIEEHLVGVEVMKFTGSMSSQERDDVVTYFNESRHPRIILVSLMAGGVGLSLHHGSASVFLAEPYYNSFVEQQAEERVHRLGQEDTVNVFRYRMTNSVETWITGMKQRKNFIASSLSLGSEPSGKVPDFSFKDISGLFNDHVNFTHNEGLVKKEKYEPVKIYEKKSRSKKNRVPKPKVKVNKNDFKDNYIN